MGSPRTLWQVIFCLYTVSFVATFYFIIDLLLTNPPSSRASRVVDFNSFSGAGGATPLVVPEQEDPLLLENQFFLPDVAFVVVELVLVSVLNASLLLAYVAECISDSLNVLYPLKLCLVETCLRIVWLVLLHQALDYDGTLIFVCVTLAVRLCILVCMHHFTLNGATRIPPWRCHIVLLSVDLTTAWVWILLLQYLGLIMNEAVSIISSTSVAWAIFVTLLVIQVPVFVTSNGSFYHVMYIVAFGAIMPQLTDPALHRGIFIAIIFISTMMFFTFMAFVFYSHSSGVQSYYQHGFLLFLSPPATDSTRNAPTTRPYSSTTTASTYSSISPSSSAIVRSPVVVVGSSHSPRKIGYFRRN